MYEFNRSFHLKNLFKKDFKSEKEIRKPTLTCGIISPHEKSAKLKKACYKDFDELSVLESDFSDWEDEQSFTKSTTLDFSPFKTPGAKKCH